MKKPTDSVGINKMGYLPIGLITILHVYKRITTPSVTRKLRCLSSVGRVLVVRRK